MNRAILVVVLIILVVIIGLVWYVNTQNATETAVPPTTEEFIEPTAPFDDTSEFIPEISPGSLDTTPEVTNNAVQP